MQGGSPRCVGESEVGHILAHDEQSEGNLTLWLLNKKGFTPVKSVTIHPGDEGTDEGNRIFDAFFGSEPVADDMIDNTFAATAPKVGHNLGVFIPSAKPYQSQTGILHRF